MYAIVCDARKGRHLGIYTLALVDRAKTQRVWWTSDDSSLILAYRKREAADYAAKRLRRNNVRVVPFEKACAEIDKQLKELIHHEAMEASETGWQGHKDTF